MAMGFDEARHYKAGALDRHAGSFEIRRQALCIGGVIAGQDIQDHAVFDKDAKGAFPMIIGAIEVAIGLDDPKGHVGSAFVKFTQLPEGVHAVERNHVLERFEDGIILG